VPVYLCVCVYTYVFSAVMVSDICIEMNTDSRSLKSTSSLMQHSVAKTYVHLINVKHMKVPLY
jgi:hypothetical protein